MVKIIKLKGGVEMIKLYFKGGFMWEYIVSKQTDAEIFAYDPTDSTFIRYNKNSKQLYSYDTYNDLWKHMKNTTEMLDGVEII